MNAEFFSHNSNLTKENELVKIDNEYVAYSEFERKNDIQKIIFQLLENDKSRKAIMAIKEHGITDVKEIFKVFKQCNWDNLDHIPDIDDDGNMNFEYVDCGFKGANKKCPYSKPGDSKPFCIIKTRILIPNYGKQNTSNTGDHKR